MPFELPTNDAAPHRAVIYIQAEMHELRPSGECAGRPIVKISQFPVYIDGVDRFITERKLNEFIQEVKKKCKT